MQLDQRLGLTRIGIIGNGRNSLGRSAKLEFDIREPLQAVTRFLKYALRQRQRWFVNQVIEIAWRAQNGTGTIRRHKRKTLDRGIIQARTAKSLVKRTKFGGQIINAPPVIGKILLKPRQHRGRE